MSWRVDYAAEGHPVWLSLEKETFDRPQLAVKMAQNKLERWPPCVGFRVVKDDHPAFEKVEERHIGKMVAKDGMILIP